MDLRAFAVLPLLLLLPGCSDAAGCPDLATTGTIREVRGNDLEVRLLDGQLAVLHVADAQILRRDPDGCRPIRVGEVTTGSNVAFEVDAWAESYPMQGWPERVVVG